MKVYNELQNYHGILKLILTGAFYHLPLFIINNLSGLRFKQLLFKEDELDSKIILLHSFSLDAKSIICHKVYRSWPVFYRMGTVMVALGFFCSIVSEF
jgi:hypothetical protein